MKQCILILGMHRSGTSAISGILNVMGVNFGSRLIRPQKNVNEKGFFEPGPVIDINNALLCEIGSYWDDIFPTPTIPMDDASITQLFSKASDYIRQDLNSNCWAIKEPRISVLMPFWQQVIERHADEIKSIFIFRHPQEVCDSLAKRDGFHQDKAYLMWIKNNLEAEMNSRNMKRYFMEFNDIFSNIEGHLGALEKHLCIEFPKKAAEVKDQLNAFISTDLRNNVAGQNDPLENASPAKKLAVELYATLLDAKQTDGGAQIQSFINYYARYLAIIDSIPEFFKQHYRSVAKERGKYENLFLTAYNSYLWKYTAPLRWLEQKLQG